MAGTVLWLAVRAANPELTDQEVDALARAASQERDVVLKHGLNFDQPRELARAELFPPPDDEDASLDEPSL